MHEQSKATRRRFNDGLFHSRYFVGNGIDIGAGNDSLAQYLQEFPSIKTLMSWDVHNGDAQYLESISDNTFDFACSSHCLEHMVDVREALLNWFRVIKAGGHLVITVPDEDMYERGVWPSRFNEDHKHSFTICKMQSWSPVSINIVDLVRYFADKATVVSIQRLESFFQPELRGDQTLRPNTECAIEIIWRKL